MSCKSCSTWTTTWTTLSRAAAKKASSVVRQIGALPVHPQWQQRAELCARCPVSTSIGGHLHCGRPLLKQLAREPHEGCGCPVPAKAKDPFEHCPVDRTLAAADTSPAHCTCKWCEAELGPRTS